MLGVCSTDEIGLYIIPSAIIVNNDSFVDDLDGIGYCRENTKMKTAPQALPWRAEKLAITYFPAEQYHRHVGLNYCVRYGNRCDPNIMVTNNHELDGFPYRYDRQRSRRARTVIDCPDKYIFITLKFRNALKWFQFTSTRFDEDDPSHCEQ